MQLVDEMECDVHPDLSPSLHVEHVTSSMYYVSV